MSGLLQDFRHGIRSFSKNPAFTVVAVLTLAIGIGGNAAMFSLVDAALLRPLPFHEPSQLLMLWEKPPKWAFNSVAPLNFLDWKEQSSSFSDMAAVASGNTTLTGAGTPESLRGELVSASFFDLLGVTPVAGRTFSPGEDQPGKENVAVISYGLWTRRFGGNLSAIGSAITLDNKPFTLIGVLPADFHLLGECDVWAPLPLPHAQSVRSSHFLRVIARLKPGRTLDSARAEMDVIAARIAQASPETNQGWGVLLLPLPQALVGSDLRTSTLVLMGAVGFVLLIACANVANLMLARGAGRAREMALRAALGATRARIAQQLFTESLMLAGAGAALGLFLARVALETSPTWLPAGTLPAAVAPRLDWRVTLFAAGVALFTGLLCGLAPVVHAGKLGLNEILRSSGYSVAGGIRLRRVLAAAEIAIAVVLIAGAGLLLRTLFGLESVDRGYRAENVLTFHVSLTAARYSAPEKVVAFYQAAAAELQRLPGVRAVAYGTDLPLEGWTFGEPFEVAGHPSESESKRTFAHFNTVSTDYFEALGIPLLRGRSFAKSDASTSPLVVVVNETLAARFFPGEDPIGKRLRFTDRGKPFEREIVGVSGQVKVQGPAEQSALELYVPYTQDTLTNGSFALRADEDPRGLASAVRGAIGAVDKELPVTQLRTLDDIAADSVARPRFRGFLLGTFAIVALILAAIGIFGVFAYSVGQRTREFGIRMALGAQPASVLRMVLGDALQLTVAGIIAGVIAAVFLTRFLAGLLFGVRPVDPVTFVAVPLFMLVVALAACLIPARRATRVNPMSALRHE